MTNLEKIKTLPAADIAKILNKEIYCTICEIGKNSGCCDLQQEILKI